MNELQLKFATDSITVAAQLSTLLRHWLSLHIRRYEKDIFHFIEKNRWAKSST